MEEAVADGATTDFGSGKQASREAEVIELYAKVSQLTVERDFFMMRSER